MEGKYITILYIKQIRAGLEGGKGEVSEAMKELFIRYYNVRKIWVPLFKRGIIEIYWEYCGIIPQNPLCSFVLCVSQWYPPALRSFAPACSLSTSQCWWAPVCLSLSPNLYLTVSKAVTVVSTVRKIFCRFLSAKARCKKALLKVFSWHCYCGCRVKASVTPLQHQAMHVKSRIQNK